jgi:hypothetical protein
MYRTSGCVNIMSGEVQWTQVAPGTVTRQKDASQRLFCS